MKTCEQVDVYIHVLLTPAVVGVEGNLHTPAALPLRKESPGTY
jgi:hypothetical protein